jgi:glycosyltransferase involved in cell wall biosynthesis
LKVLFLTHSYPRYATDPVGSFVLRLAVALRPLGVEAEVVAPGARGLAAREEFEGITVSRFRYAPRSFETLAYAGTMQEQVRQSWSARFALAGLLGGGLGMTLGVARRIRADLIHAHWWFPAGLIATWARKFLGIPVVTTLHGSDLRLAHGGGFAQRLARNVLRNSSQVTTVSKWLAAGVETVAPGVRPTVAPMPVVSDLFFGGRRERDRLLFVGKLNPQKGIEHLLRAMARMKRTPTLDVVVGVGSSETEARALADSLGIGGRIQWHPLLSQAKLALMYRQATALVVPSVDEGLGLVAVESLLSETPVVAFDSGGLPDIVLHGKTGLLVPPGQVESLASALDDLLARADQGGDFGRAGRAHALATFSPAAAAARYLDIYRVALASK